MPNTVQKRTNAAILARQNFNWLTEEPLRLALGDAVKLGCDLLQALPVDNQNDDPLRRDS